MLTVFPSILVVGTKIILQNNFGALLMDFTSIFALNYTNEFMRKCERTYVYPYMHHLGTFNFFIDVLIVDGSEKEILSCFGY